mgnify:FL=1
MTHIYTRMDIKIDIVVDDIDSSWLGHYQT